MFTRTISITIACIVGWVAPALAEHGRPGRDGECVQACTQTFRECSETARTERRACHDGCMTLIEAARAACADTEPGSEPSSECVAARTAARECLAPCREGFADDRDACVGALRGCVAACPRPTPPTPPTRPTARPTPPFDRQCIGTCRRERHECYESVREVADACRRTTCSAEAEAVASACRGHGRFQSQQCLAARAALDTCVEPCRAAVGEAAQTCAAEAEACAAACAAPTPTSDTGPAS